MFVGSRLLGQAVLHRAAWALATLLAGRRLTRPILA